MINREEFLFYHGRPEEETAFCSGYVRRWWKEETDARMETADQVCGNQFLFNLPWDMEQTTQMVSFGETIDWMYMPGKDMEFIYQLNRHRYWICLGQAYAMTGREIYARTFVSQMTDWIRRNPITPKTQKKTWRTIEAGIRAENWIKAMGYMIGSPCVTDGVLEAFTDAMMLHGQYLAACEKSFSTKSNWGILESSGLFAIGKMLEGCGTGSARQSGREYAGLALERLERQLDTQVMDDGVHWEQSPMYHNEVLRCTLEVLRLAGIYQTEVPSEIFSKTKTMLYADRFWQKPDGTQPAGGDSDSTDIRDILTAGAFCFRDPVLKSGAFPRMDYEGIWDYGQAAARAYEALASKEPEELFIWQRESGNWYLRSDWGSRADYLHVRCGSLGGGHGHFDKLHIDLVVNGEDYLIDPGRYTYMDGEERYRLKSASAHNTVTVDGQEYTHCLDAWAVSGLPSAINGGCKKKGDYTYIQCGHTGYLEQGVLVNRKILALGTKIYIVCDEFFASGSHRVRQHFHMAPACHVMAGERENGTVFVKGDSFQAKMCCLSEPEAVTQTFPISRHYNQLEEAEAVTFERETSGMGSMITVIFCADKDGRPVKDSMSGFTAVSVPVDAPSQGRSLSGQEAEGILISAQGRHYLAVIAHVDAGAHCEYIGAMNHYGAGRVMVTEVSPEEAGQSVIPGKEKNMTVLCW